MNDKPCRDIEKAWKAISHLQRRDVQADIAAVLIREFAQELGKDRAMAVAMQAVRADALKAGREMAAQYGDNGLMTLSKIVKELWCGGNAMDIDMLTETAGRLYFNVTRCGYATLYEKKGIKDLGFCLSCNRDASFAQGFNSDIKMIRSQTIMQGAPHCDFRFELR